MIAVPDGKRGETVKALLVLKPGLRGEVSEQQIVDWARERMAVYKAPRVVEFMDSLPEDPAPARSSGASCRKRRAPCAKETSA